MKKLKQIGMPLDRKSQQAIGGGRLSATVSCTGHAGTWSYTSDLGSWLNAINVIGADCERYCRTDGSYSI